MSPLLNNLKCILSSSFLQINGLIPPTKHPLLALAKIHLDGKLHDATKDCHGGAFEKSLQRVKVFQVLKLFEVSESASVAYKSHFKTLRVLNQDYYKIFRRKCQSKFLLDDGGQDDNHI